MDIYYDWEFNGDYYRVRPGGGEVAQNILGLPPVLFVTLTGLLLLVGFFALKK